MIMELSIYVMYTIIIIFIVSKFFNILAAKTYYFGVGGGLRSFEDYLIQEKIFNFTTCWKTDSGLQREILRLTFESND